MRHFIIAGNWKMNAPPSVAQELAESIAYLNVAKRYPQPVLAAAQKEGHRVIVCPPYISLDAVAHTLQGSGVGVGAQNCHHENNGAYTGEISGTMLRDLGCSWVILGHSERRRDQGETNDLIGRKAETALTVGLRPIICIGETLEQREQGKTHDVLREQLDGILNSCGKLVFDTSLLAYEPVWAIGTGLTATPDQVFDAHTAIREHCRQRNVVDIPILYGGSVTADNAEELFRVHHVNGALVGGASLKAESFLSIIDAARRASNS